VLVVASTLAALSMQIPWLEKAPAGLARRLAAHAQDWLARTPSRSPCFISILFPGSLLFASPSLGHLAGHNQELIPSRSLNRRLEIYRGERVFHSANWGGCLTWHGWKLNTRFETWMDDRTHIHGQVPAEKYRAILNALPGWDKLLADDHLDLLCIPLDTSVASHSLEHGCWRAIYRDGKIVTYRRVQADLRWTAMPTNKPAL
jgi:hypothetical protein